VNPNIPASGVIDEPKSDILSLLKDSPSAQVIPWVLISAKDTQQEREHKWTSWMEEHQLSFPIVLKPNEGQRGDGVRLMENKTTLQQFFNSNPRHKTLLQAFDARQEYSVFIWRHPQTFAFEIFSITIKTLPSVTGDGTSTLEKLILKHPRHVAMASHLLNVNADRKNKVFNNGETIQLSMVGAHCKGATFTDGRHLKSQALLNGLAPVLEHSGINFGRFDLMADNDTALQRGDNLGIIELNGVTSEATHIYSEGLSVLQAWRDMIQQWRTAIELGQRCHREGAPTTSLMGIWNMLKQYQRKVNA
jgi:hypothetical protein